MRPIIISATDKEIAGIKDKLNGTPVLITGVGIAQTLSALYTYSAIKSDSILIQVGIAGSFDTEVEPGSVVFVERDAFSMSGVWSNHSLESLEDASIGKIELTDKNGWLVNPFSFNNQLPWQSVRAVTTDLITDNQSMIQSVRERYNPQTESMEGAAFHFFCLKNRLRFIQLRGISNFVGDRDKRNWQFDMAIKNLNIALYALMNILKTQSFE